MSNQQGRRNQAPVDDTSASNGSRTGSQKSRNRPGKNQRQQASTRDWSDRMDADARNSAPPMRTDDQVQRREQGNKKTQRNDKSDEKSIASSLFKRDAYPEVIGTETAQATRLAFFGVDGATVAQRVSEVHDFYSMSGAFSKYYASRALIGDNAQIAQFKNLFIAAGVLTGVQSLVLSCLNDGVNIPGISPFKGEITHVSTVRRVTAQIGTLLLESHGYRLEPQNALGEVNRLVRLAYRISTIPLNLFGELWDDEFNARRQLYWLPTTTDDRSIDTLIRLALQCALRNLGYTWIVVSNDLPVLSAQQAGNIGIPPWWAAIGLAHQVLLQWFFWFRPNNWPDWIVWANGLPQGLLNQTGGWITRPRNVVMVDLMPGHNMGIQTGEIVTRWTRMIGPLPTFFLMAGKESLGPRGSATTLSEYRAAPEEQMVSLASVEPLPATELSLAMMFPLRLGVLRGSLEEPGRSLLFQGNLEERKDAWLRKAVNEQQ